MKRIPFGLGWLIAIVMLVALACTCGPLSQAQEGVQTAQAVVTQGQGLATQVEESGVLETVQAAATFAATTGAVETYQAGATQVTGATSGEVPDDIPIFTENAGVQVIAGVITYTAHADVATIIEFYKVEMPKNGWTLKEDLGQVFIFEKGDRTASFNLIDAEEATVIGIQVQP